MMRCTICIRLLTEITSVGLLAACGGGGSNSTPGPPPVLNATPGIVALSPNSSEQGGSSFTLSVVGSNFIAGTSIRFNGIDLPTTVVNAQLATAPVPASALSSGPVLVSAVNPAPGGGTSNALQFAVPCVIAPATPASGQARARVGAYYFDGWAGSLTNAHFKGLLSGAYQDRQPLSAWQDSSPCAVEQQLGWAHSFGIDFFVFDWYFNTAVNFGGDQLNSALSIMRSLPNRHGMEYAILYVSGDPGLIGPADWPAAVTEWVGYMTDPAYVRVNGKPVLFIINVGEVRRAFGTSAGVSAALSQLRAAAQAQGLPGVYVIGGFGPPNGTMGKETLDDGFSTAQLDGYDAVALYNYPFAPPPVNGALPFSTLSAAGHWTWEQARLHCPLPFIPTAMSGWDPRPWNEVEPTSGDLLWYERTPADVATLVDDAIAWVGANPGFRVEQFPAPPMVLIEAWNEFGEGSYFLPTVGDDTSYGAAIATVLQGP
jgi:hypothetical protein